VELNAPDAEASQELFSEISNFVKSESYKEQQTDFFLLSQSTWDKVIKQCGSLEG